MRTQPETTVSLSLGERGPCCGRPIRVLAQSHERPTYVAPHLHDALLQFLVPMQGTLRVFSPDAFWIVPPKRGILIPMALKHSTMAIGRTSLLVANIHPSAIDATTAHCRVIGVSDLIAALLERIARFSTEYPLNSPDSRLVDVFFEQFLAAPAEPFRLARPRDARLRTIADALIVAPDDETTLAEWGQRLGASQRTLARRFDAEIGMGFRDYRKLVQMHAATGLLAQGLSINHVALDLGYENASAFIHAFRSVMGMTPGCFRSAKNFPESQ